MQMLMSRFIGFTKVWLLLLMLGLSGCGSVDIHDYSASEPKLDLQQFFNGELQASGMVEDYSGQVVRSFNVRMTGSWQGNQGVCCRSGLSMTMVSLPSEPGRLPSLPMAATRAEPRIFWGWQKGKQRALPCAGATTCC